MLSKMAVRAGSIRTRIVTDKSGFSQIFREKSVKIRFHPVKSAFQWSSLNSHHLETYKDVKRADVHWRFHRTAFHVFNSARASRCSPD